MLKYVSEANSPSQVRKRRAEKEWSNAAFAAMFVGLSPVWATTLIYWAVTGKYRSKVQPTEGESASA